MIIRNDEIFGFIIFIVIVAGIIFGTIMAAYEQINNDMAEKLASETCAPYAVFEWKWVDKNYLNIKGSKIKIVCTNPSELFNEKVVDFK